MDQPNQQKPPEPDKPTPDPKPVCEIMLVLGRASDGRFRVAVVERGYSKGDIKKKIERPKWGSMREAIADISRALPKLQDWMRRRLPVETRSGEVDRG
jgi:hypothetical protein